MLTAIILIVSLAILAVLVWLIMISYTEREKLSVQGKSLDSLTLQIDSLKTAQSVTTENLQKTLLSGQSSMIQNLQSSQQILTELGSQIGGLRQTGTQMLQIQSDIRRLQDILSSPKMRGGLGEWSLKNILENALPKDSYELQYSFRDGKIVDAVVKMTDYIVPIDAKFPLPSFEGLMKAQSEDEKLRLRKQFQNDVIKHIDKISASYIRPVEKTLDFAIMYIPAENVYYEAVVKYAEDSKDIQQYALEKKVVPAGPNLLYVYLMTVVMGLHGLQIEKQAADILQNLKTLNSSFGDFGQTWEVIGRHLRNAQNQYEEGNSKLNKFGMQLGNIQEKTHES